jgi:hypothetical protein
VTIPVRGVKSVLRECYRVTVMVSEWYRVTVTRVEGDRDYPQRAGPATW